MTMNAYTLHALNMNDTAGSADYLIDQVSAFSLNPNVQAVLGNSDGNVDPTYIATMSAAPSISCTTTKLATLLGKATSAFLLTGQALASGAFNCEAWFHKLEEGSTRATTGHKKLTVTQGLLVPRGISAQQGGEASFDLDVIATQYSTTKPIVVADSALTGSPAVSELYTLGPVNLNGSALSGVQGVSIDPGLNLFVQTSAGLEYPQGVAIMSRAPSITVELTDMAVLSSITLDGVDLSSGADIYLRKIASGDTRVSDATAEHIKITVGAGMAHLDPVSVNHNGHAAPGLRITPIVSGGSILTISTASAIT